MGLFTTTKFKVVTPHEYNHKVLSDLEGHGFNHRQIEHVNDLLQESLANKIPQDKHIGIDQQEIDNAISRAAQHEHIHGIDAQKREILKETLMKHLQ